jgi:DNA-directed RNA polymerase subunit K/omega
MEASPRMIHYPDNLESKFRFVTLASLRCDQLQKGAKARITSRTQKHTTVAQEEVLAGEVNEMTPEEIAEAQEAAATEIEVTEEAVEAGS